MREISLLSEATLALMKGLYSNESSERGMAYIIVCYSLCYNAPTMLPTGGQPATSWVHYTTSCNTQSSAAEDGQNN